MNTLYLNETIMEPIHPGEILREDFLEPMGISQNELARALRVAPGRINEIVNKKRGISAETAMRLGRYFGMDPAFWVNLQTHYDLEVARDTVGAAVEREVLPRALA